MDKFIDKLSEYNILNNILPGAVYFFLLDWLFDLNIIGNNWIENVFVYYFFGMVISRIGSLIVEPLCRRCKFVEYVPYSDYIKAAEKDGMIKTMSTTNNVYRTMIGMIMWVALTGVFNKLVIISPLIKCGSEILFLLIVFLLFMGAYRKQVGKIKERVECNVL